MNTTKKIEKEVRDFCSWMEAQDYAATTISIYSGYLKKFLKDIGDWETILSFERRVFINSFSEQSKKEMAQTAINAYLRFRGVKNKKGDEKRTRRHSSRIPKLDKASEARIEKFLNRNYQKSTQQRFRAHLRTFEAMGPEKAKKYLRKNLAPSTLRNLDTIFNKYKLFLLNEHPIKEKGSKDLWKEGYKEGYKEGLKRS